MAERKLNRIFAEALQKLNAKFDPTNRGKPKPEAVTRASAEQFWFAEAGALWVYEECMASYKISGRFFKVDAETETCYQTIIKPALAKDDTKAEMLRRLADPLYSIELLQAGK